MKPMSLLFPLTWCLDSGDCIVMRNCSSPSSSFVGVSTAAAVAVETVDSGETVIDDGEVKEVNECWEGVLKNSLEWPLLAENAG